MTRTAVLAAAAALLAVAPAPAAAESVVGIYAFHRHGDRTAKAFKPTTLTALGAQQCAASGNYFRDRYVSSNATDETRIAALRPDLVLLSQLGVTAPVDGVLESSAGFFLQALYPPAGTTAAQKLGNGSTTENPLGGYQYIPVTGVDTAASSSGSENSAWLQGSSGCGNAVVSSNSYFSSAEYLDTLESTRGFYDDLAPALNTTFSSDAATFKNAYSIWDYIHVSEIHNATLFGESVLTDDRLFQLRTRADQHEWGLAYNASEPIRAISGSILAAQALQGLNTTANAPPAKKSATRFNIKFGAYATFMSFFGLADLPSVSSDFTGVVDYASSIVFELVTNASTDSNTTAIAPADLSVRFLFSNGSAGLSESGLTPYPLFGGSELLMPWTNFTAAMGKIAIGDTATWCHVCGNTTGTCDPVMLGTASSNSSSNPTATAVAESHHNNITRPVAGVIGALVTLGVILGLEALIMVAGGLRVVKKNVAAAGKAAHHG